MRQNGGDGILKFLGKHHRLVLYAAAHVHFVNSWCVWRLGGEGEVQSLPRMPQQRCCLFIDKVTPGNLVACPAWRNRAAVDLWPTVVEVDIDDIPGACVDPIKLTVGGDIFDAEVETLHDSGGDRRVGSWGGLRF